MNSSRAGPGSVTVEVTGPRTKSQPRVVADGNSTAEVTFRTVEAGEHKVKVFFNGIPVPGLFFIITQHRTEVFQEEDSMYVSRTYCCKSNIT